MKDDASGATPGMSRAEAVAELARLGRHADARQLDALMVAIRALERAIIHRHRNREARAARKGGIETPSARRVAEIDDRWHESIHRREAPDAGQSPPPMDEDEAVAYVTDALGWPRGTFGWIVALKAVHMLYERIFTQPPRTR